MNAVVDTFVALGERLRSFGDDAPSREVIAAACRLNPWFTPAEVRRAVEAIRVEMLDRARLTAWWQRYGKPLKQPRNVLVVMAGNIPLVGFFDLLCVLVAGHRCHVKPASKDRPLMTYIMAELRRLDSVLPLAEYDGVSEPDAVIATGSNNARRYFATRYAGRPLLLRGSRHSVAVLTGTESESQWAGLADDIWAYSGLGCRSVAMLLLPHGVELRLKMPPMNEKYRRNYLQNRALLEMQGREYLDLGCATAVEGERFATSLSRLTLRRYAHLQEAEAWISAHDEALQCVVTTALDHSRRVDFGRAQQPTLEDWPDDVNVLDFLADI